MTQPNSGEKIAMNRPGRVRINFDKNTALGTSLNVSAIWGREGAMVAPAITVSVDIRSRDALTVFIGVIGFRG